MIIKLLLIHCFHNFYLENHVARRRWAFVHPSYGDPYSFLVKYLFMFKCGLYCQYRWYFTELDLYPEEVNMISIINHSNLVHLMDFGLGIHMRLDECLKSPVIWGRRVLSLYISLAYLFRTSELRHFTISVPLSSLFMPEENKKSHNNVVILFGPSLINNYITLTSWHVEHLAETIVSGLRARCQNHQVLDVVVLVNMMVLDTFTDCKD